MTVRGGPGGRVRGALRHLHLLLGPAALLWLFSKVGLSEILAALGTADPWLVGAAMAFVVPALLLRSLRWKVLLGADGAGMSYGEVTAVFAYAVFVGTPTPGRIGEFYKIVHLRARGLPVGRALASVLLDRLFDVTMLLMVGTGAVALLLGAGEGRAATWILGGYLVGLFAARALACGTPGDVLARALAPAAPRRIRQKAGALRRDLCAALDDLSLPQYGAAAVLSAAAWSVNYVAAWLLARSVGLPLSLVDVAGISAVGSLVSLLPISVMGAGTRDLAVVTLLSAYGVSRPRALAFSTLLLAFLVATALVCGYSLFSGHVRRRAPRDVGHAG